MGIGPDSEVDLLWERSCNAWNINSIRTNSAMQLFTHDLTQKSNPIFFNNDGRSLVLETSPNEPWAGGDSVNS